MDIAVVDPDLHTALKRLPPIDVTRRFGRWFGRALPAIMPSHRVDGVSVTKVSHGGVRARIYGPASAVPTAGLLWIHGGGLVLGAAKQDERLCAETAGRLGITVVSVEYRLAPEAPFPAGLDDVSEAWEWMLGSAAELGLDPARLAIGGESAGAGLAAALVQRVHDAGGPQPVAQWLFAPMLDDRTAANRDLDGIDHWVWNNTSNRYGWSAYLGAEPGASTLPDYSVPARRANLAGLPPAWLSVGDIELFHGEAVDYAARLRSAGVDTELVVVPGGAHAFENWAATAPTTDRLLAGAWEWLGARLT